MSGAGGQSTIAAFVHGGYVTLGFSLKWSAFAAIAAAIDGAFLGGVAAVISAIGTLLLGLLAYRRGHERGRATEADAWRLLAESRERELDHLRGDDG